MKNAEQRRWLQGVVWSLAWGGLSLAQAGELPSREEMWAMIQKQQKEIEALKTRVNATHEEMKQAATKAEEARDDVKEVAASGAGTEREPSWSDRITVSGGVEVEASAGKGFDGVGVSDITLATATLAVDARVNDWVAARIALLHEDDSTEPMELDEGIITIGNAEVSPFYLAGGRMYVPFGRFDSQLISDPLTLELGETRESALQVGFEQNGFHGSIWAFNGDADKNGRDRVEHLGANLGYALTGGEIEADLGLSLTNALADSDGVSAALSDAGVNLSAMQEHVTGLGLYGTVGWQGFTLIGEYLGATDDFAATELAWEAGGARPRAWNTELGYSFEMMGKSTTAALSWQGTDESVGLGLPEDRYLIGAAMDILENTTLAVEWAHDDDYSVMQGGTGNDGDTATMQLAVSF